MVSCLVAVTTLGYTTRDIVASKDLLAQVGDYNAGANASVSLRASIFQKIFTDLIPWIESEALSIDVPGQSAKHYSFDSFKISSFSIGSATIAFQAPNILKVGMNDISASVPHTHFSVFKKIFDEEMKAKGEVGPDFKISCSGDFWASISGTSVDFSLALATDANGKLTVTSVTPNINFGNVDINHDLHSFLCKVGQDIIQLFLGNINNIIKNTAEQEIPKVMTSLIKSLVDKELPKLPLTFVSQPTVVEDTVAISLQLIAPSGDFDAPMHVASSPLPLSPGFGMLHTMPFTDRDVAGSISDVSFNDIVALLAQDNKFDWNYTFPASESNTSILKPYIPAAYNMCPDCPFKVNYHVLPSSPPFGVFQDGTIEFSFTDVSLGVNARDTNGTVLPLFDLSMNLTFSLTNFSIANHNVTSNIKFLIGIETFGIGLERSFVGPFDIASLSASIESFLQFVVVPLFNAEFKGVPLTFMKNGFGLDQWLIEVKGNSIVLGANIVVPPL